MGWWHDLSRIVFPEVCNVCGEPLVEGERVLCLGCLAKMPRVNIHLNPHHELSMRFVAAAKVERVAAMFPYLRDNDYARLIQHSKYNNRPDIDFMLAEEFAAELKPSGFFNGIDVIIPVPMHWRKKFIRGYNQAEEIAKGISAIVGIEVADNLVASRSHKTQTRKNANERRLNAEGIYTVAYADELEGKHVLLVDDVITTGATMLSCCDALRSAVANVRISVLSLAATRLA